MKNWRNLIFRKFFANISRIFRVRPREESVRSVENFSKSYLFTQVKYAPHQFRIFFNIMTWDYKILFGSLLQKPEITLELHGRSTQIFC